MQEKGKKMGKEEWVKKAENTSLASDIYVMPPELPCKQLV